MPVIPRSAPMPARPQPATASSWSIRSTARKEFVAGRDEYTVNIALVTRRHAVARRRRGAGARPDLARRRRARRRAAAIATGRCVDARRSRSTPGRSPRPASWIAAVSRSHLDAGARLSSRAARRGPADRCGSALKFCRLAEGAADIYPRLAPTCEWDIAAGHAMLAAAGGKVTDRDGSALRFGERSRRVPGAGFIAWGDPSGCSAETQRSQRRAARHGHRLLGRLDKPRRGSAAKACRAVSSLKKR